MNEAVQVLAEPTRLRSGMGVVRVVAKAGNAAPEICTGTGWEEVDGSYLADVLEGTMLSPDDLSELGIFATEEDEIRSALNARFPVTIFAVTTQNHRARESLMARWTDGPTKRLVQEVIQWNNRVSLERHLSERFVKRAEAQLNGFYGIDSWNGERRTLIEQAAEDATLFSRP